MKNLLNSKDIGLVELSHEEQKEISGGLIFGFLAVAFAIISAVAALIDYAQKE